MKIFKESVTTTDDGYYVFCITNSDDAEELSVYITLKSGFEARDYTEFAKKHDLKPIELQVDYTYLNNYIVTKTWRNYQFYSYYKFKSSYTRK